MATNDVVHATDGYSRPVTNMSQVTIASDNVFGDDDAAHEMGAVTGSVTKVYLAKLTAAIDPDGTEDATSAQGGPPGGMPQPAAG